QLRASAELCRSQSCQAESRRQRQSGRSRPLKQNKAVEKDYPQTRRYGRTARAAATQQTLRLFHWPLFSRASTPPVLQSQTIRVECVGPKNGGACDFRPHPTVPRHKANAVRHQLWKPVSRSTTLIL